MKKSLKKSANIENRQGTRATAGSPFAAAAALAAGRTMVREQARNSPFDAAMEKAAAGDKIKRVITNKVRATQMGELMGAPAKKKTRATKFDAKKMRDITQ